jgi:hypothetical protein
MGLADGMRDPSAFRQRVERLVIVIVWIGFGLFAFALDVHIEWKRTWSAARSHDFIQGSRAMQSSTQLYYRFEEKEVLFSH